jgi:hypothetical protein
MTHSQPMVQVQLNQTVLDKNSKKKKLYWTTGVYIFISMGRAIAPTNPAHVLRLFPSCPNSYYRRLRAVHASTDPGALPLQRRLSSSPRRRPRPRPAHRGPACGGDPSLLELTCSFAGKETLAHLGASFGSFCGIIRCLLRVVKSFDVV